jgi:guanylate kinase
MNKKGILIILSGFSGVGKGTVVKRLLSDYDNYVLSISATTRKPREGEEEGISYFFKSKEDFEQMIKDDAFVEHARYVDNYYGTPKAYVQEQLDAGKDVILEIEIQGALKVKEKYPDALMLFLVPPDARTLKERLIGRGTETAEVIHDRLKRAAQEAQEMGSYEYIIVNDDLDTCVKQVHALIQSAHCKKSHNTEFIKELQQDMNCFLKGE